MTPGAPVGGRPGVCLLNLGCRVNRVELDLMASELEAAGAVLVDEAEADAIVIITNTMESIIKLIRICME